MTYDGLRLTKIVTLLLDNEPLTSGQITRILTEMTQCDYDIQDSVRTVLQYYVRKGYLVKCVDRYGALRYSLADSVAEELTLLATVVTASQRNAVLN